MSGSGLTYQTVFVRLNRARVRYLVVGGVAMGLHGYSRFTADLNLFVDLAPANAERALRVLMRLGLQPLQPVNPLDFADPSIRRKWIREKGMRAFPWRHPRVHRFHLDVFVDPPLPFAKAWKRRRSIRVGAHRIPVAGLQDLLRMKQLADRDKDRMDIRVLKSWIWDRSE